jgi:periplasmic nitrate reductase NapD
MTGEFHITSLVVHARPESLDAVARAIASFEGAEIQARSEQGKLVVTVESGNEETVTGCLARIGLLEGVLAATLVYHHCEPAEVPEPNQD